MPRRHSTGMGGIAAAGLALGWFPPVTAAQEACEAIATVREFEPGEILLTTATRLGKPDQPVSLLQNIPAHLLFERDMVYWEGSDHPLHKLDILYFADRSDLRPVIIFIHGGGMTNGWKDQHGFPEAMLYFAKRGYVTLSIDYRLAPYAPMPAQLEDAKTAVRWLRAHADDYGVDADRIGAAGHSAGGTLAALLAYADGFSEWDIGRPYDTFSSQVQAAVPAAGSYDHSLEALAYTVDLSDPQERRHLWELVGGDPVDHPERLEATSAIHWLSSDDPPMLVIHGTHDEVVDVWQAYHILAVLQQWDLAHEALLVEGGMHDKWHLFEGEGLQQMEQFFDEHFDMTSKPRWIIRP